LKVLPQILQTKGLGAILSMGSSGTGGASGMLGDSFSCIRGTFKDKRVYALLNLCCSVQAATYLKKSITLREVVSAMENIAFAFCGAPQLGQHVMLEMVVQSLEMYRGVL
jgi:hypothetical protein